MSRCMSKQHIATVQRRVNMLRKDIASLPSTIVGNRAKGTTLTKMLAKDMKYRLMMSKRELSNIEHNYNTFIV